MTSEARKIPYAEFRSIVQIELSGNANRAHQEVLRRPEYAVRWLRMLTTIWTAVERQNAAANASIQAHPGRRAQSGPAAHDFRKAKRKHDAEHARREWVLTNLADRIAEAKDIICEQDAVSAEALERLATRLLRCDDLLKKGEVDGARNVLRATLSSIHSIATISVDDAIEPEQDTGPPPLHSQSPALQSDPTNQHPASAEWTSHRGGPIVSTPGATVETETRGGTHD